MSNMMEQDEGYERGPEWYDESFDNNEHWRRHYTRSRYYPMWAVISDRVLREGKNSVLDIGCGPGQFALLLRERGLPHYLGFDFSSRRIEWARKVCPGFGFMVADAFETDLFRSYHYDAVLCTEFLEHVERDIEVIKKISADTSFYASVPNFPFKSHVRHFNSMEQVRQRYSEHFEHFSVNEFPSNATGRLYYIMEGKKR